MNITMISSKDNIDNHFIQYCPLKQVNIEYIKLEQVLSINLKDHNSDVFLIDVEKLDIEAMTLCKRLKNLCTTPIILMEDRPNSDTEHLAFDIGCIDYIKKPYTPQSLLSRIQSHFKRNNSRILYKNTVFGNNEDYIYNIDSYRVIDGANLIKLSRHESLILEILLLNKKGVVSREDIVSHIYLDKIDINFQKLRVVDTHIKNLRKKLPKCQFISVRGIGYYVT